MATAATIKKNIAKLEAALKSKATPKSLKSKLETQLVKSKAELSGLNKGSKPKTSSAKSTQTALQKLKEMVNKNKKLKTYKKSGVDLERDADRPALPIGRRTAKKSGNTYYEYRANRIDVKQPPKRYPKLEKGGYMAKGGKVKFYDIVDDLIDYDVQYDGDPTDLRLFSELRYAWGAKNKKDYEKAQDEIDNIKYEGKGWEIYASYDTSSYEYWMKQMQEQNYIYISISFDEDTIDASEVEKLKEALDKAITKAEAISIKYDYDPQGDDEDEYKKGGYMDETDWNETRKWAVDSMSEAKLKNFLAENYGFRGVDGKGLTKDPKDRTIENMRKEVIRQMEYNDKHGGYMAKGGKIENQYEGRNASDIWKNLDRGQRYHFIIDHEDVIQYAKDVKELPFLFQGQQSRLDWDKLDKDVKRAFEQHVRDGEYAKGGSLSSIKEEYDENEDNNAHSENVVLLAKHFGTKEDLVEAKRILALHEKEGHLSSENGKKRQELHLKLIEKARTAMDKEGIEFAKGGKLSGLEKSIEKTEKAIEYFEKEKENGNEYADYALKSLHSYLAELKEEQGGSKMAKGGYYAKGGAMEHGLKRGDTIIDDMSWDNSVKVLNNKTGYAVVHLETGERKEMKAMGGEMHRTQE